MRGFGKQRLRRKESTVPHRGRILFEIDVFKGRIAYPAALLCRGGRGENELFTFRKFFFVERLEKSVADLDAIGKTFSL